MKFTQFEYRWGEAAMGAIFPGSTELGFRDVRAMDVPGYLEEVLRHVPLQTMIGMRAAIWLLALAPLFILGRFTTIVGLGLADRERVVQRIAASRIYAVRSMVLILKTIGALLYGGDDTVRARMLAPRAAIPIAPESGLVQLRAKSVEAA